MLIEQKRVQSFLRALARRSPHCACVDADDLIQELSAHLCRIETELPDQTRSWYLRSCRLFLADYLARGRSLDSPKRAASRSPLPCPGAGEDGDWAEDDRTTVGEADPMPQIYADDTFQVLAKHLERADVIVLHWLCSGAQLTEIAAALRLSVCAVSKRRSKIAAKAIRLGITPRR